MTVFLESVPTALTVSLLAVLCLASLPRAHPRLRYAIAAVGLCAWAVPWGLIRLPVARPAVAPLDEWIARARSGPALREALGESSPLRFVTEADLGIAVATLFTVGLALFISDRLRARKSLEEWRGRSHPAEHLRQLLPDRLRSRPTEIRLVPGTRVATTSGWLRPIIWIGDGFASAEDTRVALVHEAWHVRRADALWMAAILGIARLYWWNPIVLHLSRRALHFLECCCDLRCAETFGRRRYVERLATIVRDHDPAPATRLFATLSGRNSNVERLRCLASEPRVRLREAALVVPVMAAAAILVTYQLAAPRSAAPAWSAVPIPSTPAGESLEMLLGAINGGETELVNVYLGAYTPQEISAQAGGWHEALELVDVVKSEPLSIEYVVKRRSTGALLLGVLEVSDAATRQLARTDWQAYRPVRI